jgi:hypothetical protein
MMDIEQFLFDVLAAIAAGVAVAVICRFLAIK